jgi:ferredoxin
LKASFEIIYAAKSKRSGPFQEVVSSFGVPVHWHFDDEACAPPNLHPLIQERIQKAACTGDECQLYACGPEPMLNAFLDACKVLSLKNANIERFKAVEVIASQEAKRAYTVALKKSNKTIEVTPEMSLLQALRHHHIEVDTSCEEGVCGACETRVLSGEPEHMDCVLSDQERDKNTVMMVCVSGCKSERLELDL